MRKNNTQKIMSIEEQIKDLKEKKAKMVTDLHIKVGELVVKEWDSMDIENISYAVKNLKEEAKLLIEENSQDENKEVSNNEKEGNAVGQ